MSSFLSYIKRRVTKSYNYNKELNENNLRRLQIIDLKNYYCVTTIIYVLLHTKTTVNVFRSNRGSPDDTGG